MIELGRMVMKLAGRDAGKLGIIIKVIDDNYVLIDGEARRRKCNITHLEPLAKVLEIKEDASNNDVVKVFKEAGFEIKEKKESTKKAKPRPKKVRQPREKPVSKKTEKVKKKTVEAEPAKKVAKKKTVKKTVKKAKD